MKPSDSAALTSFSAEGRYFIALHNACRAHDPKAALDNLVAWIGSCCLVCPSISASHFAAAVGDNGLAEQIMTLREAVDSNSTDWSGRELCQVVMLIRRKLSEAPAFLENSAD